MVFWEGGFSQHDLQGRQFCVLTFLGYQGVEPQATARGYRVIRNMRVWLAREKKHNSNIIIFVGSRPEVCGIYF